MKKIMLLIALLGAFSCTKVRLDIKTGQKGDLPNCVELTPTSEMISRMESGLAEQARRVAAGSPGYLYLYLDFDGAYIPKGSWSPSGLFLAPSGLTADQQNQIVESVKSAYSPFNTIVTTDSSVYSNAPANNRQRCVITTSYEWYGKAGGVAYLGSSSYGDDTPCFVFSNLLGYWSKAVGDAVAHELGHTVGLRHQALYDGNCTLLDPYNPGYGTGETAFAPIMGTSYSKPLANWFTGTVYCDNIQNEFNILTGRIGLRSDDFPSKPTNLPPVANGVVNGVLNSPGDVDCISVSAKTVSVIATSSNFIPSVEMITKGSSKYIIIRGVANPNTSGAISSGGYQVTLN